MANQKQSVRDDFEVWLIGLDAVLERFIPEVENGKSAKLNFSMESLRTLELWIKQHYQSAADIKVNTMHLDGSARYTGEVIRIQLGGKRDIELVDQDDAFFKIPVVAGESYGSECPLSLVTASLPRSNATYIFDVVSYLSESALNNGRG